MSLLFRVDFRMRNAGSFVDVLCSTFMFTEYGVVAEGEVADFSKESLAIFVASMQLLRPPTVLNPQLRCSSHSTFN